MPVSDAELPASNRTECSEFEACRFQASQSETCLTNPEIPVLLQVSLTRRSERSRQLEQVTSTDLTKSTWGQICIMTRQSKSGQLTTGRVTSSDPGHEHDSWQRYNTAAEFKLRLRSSESDFGRISVKFRQISCDSM